jgi:hypothetical protein
VKLGELLVPAALALAGGAVALDLQARAEVARAAAKETTEEFLLPPPEQLARASLGYRAALADYLWAHVLVTQGLRLNERRRFATITDYLTAITHLDPDFREPYRLADTLTTMQTKSATVEDLRAARRVMERGAERFPDDAEIHLVTGQFLAFVAPASYLRDRPDEASEWRLAGARYLARAAELGSHDASIAWRAIGGAGTLHRAGERQATIDFYVKALAVTEDEELAANIRRHLAGLLGEAAADRERQRRATFEALSRRGYPSAPPSLVLAGGPPFDPASCAGGTASSRWGEARCATSWRDWVPRMDAQLEAELLEPPAPPSAPAPSAPPPPEPTAPPR